MELSFKEYMNNYRILQLWINHLSSGWIIQTGYVIEIYDVSNHK